MTIIPIAANARSLRSENIAEEEVGEGASGFVTMADMRALSPFQDELRPRGGQSSADNELQCEFDSLQLSAERYKSLRGGTTCPPTFT